MSLLSPEVLKVTLSDWTHAFKLAAKFNEPVDKLKKELDVYVQLGMLEKQGERKGVQYKWKGEVTEGAATESAETTEPESEEEAKSVHDISSYTRQRDKEKAHISNASIYQLLEWITTTPINDPSVCNHTFAVKRTADGTIDVNVYMGCLKLRSESYTPEKFRKLLAKSIKPTNVESRC